MKKKRGYLKSYLFLAAIIGLLGIIDGTLTLLKIDLGIVSLFLAIIFFLFLFVNIISIAFFHHNRVERIAYLFPIYYVIKFLSFFAIGTIITLEGATATTLLTISIVALSLAVLEIVFVFYLMVHLKMFKQKGATSYTSPYWEPPKF